MAALAAAGCSSHPSARPPLPPAPPVVDVVMREYSFSHLPGVKAGRVVFRFTNAGTQPHSAVLVALPEDVPPIDEQLRSDERRAVATYARIPDRPPGSHDTFAVDLAPGRYALICFTDGADGVTHALKGMSSEIRAR